jgi:hypothetical protein
MNDIDSLEEKLSNVNVNRRFSVFKYKKKQAANDAQLLM